MEEDMVVCPTCLGAKTKGSLCGVPLPCPVCCGEGKVKNDPWWIQYYIRSFGRGDDGVQLSLFET